jgi:hypothetical protein
MCEPVEMIDRFFFLSNVFPTIPLIDSIALPFAILYYLLKGIKQHP